MLPFVKVTLTWSSSAPKHPSLLHWLVSLSYVLTESPWGMRRIKVWKSYSVICHRKRLIFWISETQTLVFSLLDPQRDLVTTVVALGCSKSIGPSTNANCSGFCNLSDIFSVHLGRGCAWAWWRMTSQLDGVWWQVSSHQVSRSWYESSVIYTASQF